MATADSIRDIDEALLRRIHSRHTSGTLHKGHGITAATASIPSKYQTVVADGSDKKGFMAKSKRFQYDINANENPGPGNYVGHTTLESNSTSLSKRGTGGFASKSTRSTKYLTTYSPGGAAYKLPSLLSTRKDFNRTNNAVFHKPIAKSVEKPDYKPAPNIYDVLKYKTGKVNNVSACASFKSQSKREVIDVKGALHKPAPWQYDVKDTLVRNSVKENVSSFKSRTQRQMQADPAPVPGPGTYHPGEPMEKVQTTQLPRKHYLCISAPAMPLPAALPDPGPGSYEMVNYEGPQKHYMSSSMFVSSSSRWTGDLTGADLPGPAQYHPSQNGKQSFIYNSAGRWI